MKKVLNSIVILFTLLLFAGCDGPDYQGAPRSVVFEAEGGTIVIPYVHSLWPLSLRDYPSGESVGTADRNMETGIETITSEWLNLVASYKAQTVTLTAKPNESSKQRTLCLDFQESNYSGGTVWIYQKGKK